MPTLVKNVSTASWLVLNGPRVLAWPGSPIRPQWRKVKNAGGPAIGEDPIAWTM
jgi:hypothetical protein